MTGPDQQNHCAGPHHDGDRKPGRRPRGLRAIRVRHLPHGKADPADAYGENGGVKSVYPAEDLKAYADDENDRAEVIDGRE